MEVGYAVADITPPVGLTLSGFASRCNAPAVGVHDPLSVRVIALREGERSFLIMVYDLLGLGPEMSYRINTLLDERLGSRVPASRRVLCATHTHSAPAAVRLIGCGVMEHSYRALVADRTLAAAEEALARLREARIRTASRLVSGLSYNRRTLLRDGRLVMGRVEGPEVAKVGPVWPDARLLRFDDERGEGIVGLLNWAAHPTTQSSLEVSGDYPAELCRQMEERYGFPFVFLQGPAGNISPAPAHSGFDALAPYVASIIERLAGLQWSEPSGGVPVEQVSSTVALSYAPLPSAEELDRTSAAMARIRETGRGEPGDIATLNNILNVPPGGRADPAMLRYIAGVLKSWAADTLDELDRVSEGCELGLSALRVGNFVLLTIAAEVFSETGLRIVKRCAGSELMVVGYGAPLVGYLPTDEALAEGGYESHYAYRFYGHPAPFAPGSETLVVEEAVCAVRRVMAAGRTGQGSGS